ncbi:Metabotropic glutamate receptor-like protein [Trichinella spiralis]|uniref:Metabotropic glutamate receptor-like protein n=1 Tax=Trichinella spiralis TaxID=6334 RepID=A0ABR3K9J4_TRISP
MLTRRQYFLICALVQLWQCEGMEFAAYLPDFGVTCVLDKQEVSMETLKNYKMKVLPNLSVQECILLCDKLLKPNCIAIKHSLEGSVCYTFSNKKNVTERNYGPYTLTYFNECIRGSYFLSEIKNNTRINTKVLLIPFNIQEEEATYIVENRATVESIWAKVIAISKNESLYSCLIHCNGQSKKKGCKAVIYNPVAKKCSLLKGETVSPPVSFSWNTERHLFLLHLTVPWDLKINSVFITTKHNVTYELISKSRSTANPKLIEHPRTEKAQRTSTEGFVQLYRYLELCKINHSYCAIVYSKKKYECELLKRDTERSGTYFADTENNLVELLECYPDRQDERRNNPPPVRYYLKEIGEICVVEFYNVTDLYDFNSFESLENVENIKSCIYACRLKHETHMCLGINYTVKKQCILFQRQVTPAFYIVEPQSLFAEILFCELGTLVDEILDF